jgi:hypothetical protein
MCREATQRIVRQVAERCTPLSEHRNLSPLSAPATGLPMIAGCLVVCVVPQTPTE